MQEQILHISINSFQGTVPVGYDLVEYEKGEDPDLEGMVLYGFDEVGTMGFVNPQHAFVKMSEETIHHFPEEMNFDKVVLS